jgi:cytochrome c oxidase subunit IV
MRTYVAVTGLLFVIIAISHIVRAFLEKGLVRNLGFLSLTVLVVLLAVWASALLRKQPTPVQPHGEP